MDQRAGRGAGESGRRQADEAPVKVSGLAGARGIDSAEGRGRSSERWVRGGGGGRAGGAED